MAVLAMALSFYQLTRPNMLFGVSEYDDGAYFGSAVRLVHGALPYRNFVLVQPPGFTLLASPLALLSRAVGTRDALATARLFMPLVAALNVVLVGMLVRHRGELATLVAAGLMAVFPAEIHATHTLLLEPFLDLFCLLGAVLIFSGERFAGSGRRLLLGGVALGFAGTIKGWALIPVVVILVLCLPQVRRRVVPVLAGIAVGFAVPTLPFAVLAPGSFYREVIATQLRRIGGSGRVPAGNRLGDLTGSSSLTPSAAASLAVAIVLLVALAALIVATVVRPRRRPTTFEWFVLGSMLAIGVLLLAPAEFYDHYAAFFAPFLAMAVGGGIARLWRRPTVRAALAVATVLLAALAANEVRIVSGTRGTELTQTVGAVIPAGACALSDSSAYLITTNRFVSTVPGCTNVVADPYGTTISYGGRTPEAVAVWQHEIDGADYLVLYSLRNGRIPLVDSLRAQIARDFTPVRAGNLLVYVRHGFPTG
jgi:4-amino-4-deoxy-L-arabinose transferase-like glycosyltransferase